MLYDELDEKFKRHYEATYLNQVFQLKTQYCRTLKRILKSCNHLQRCYSIYDIYLPKLYTTT